MPLFVAIGIITVLEGFWIYPQVFSLNERGLLAYSSQND